MKAKAQGNKKMNIFLLLTLMVVSFLIYSSCNNGNGNSSDENATEMQSDTKKAEAVINATNPDTAVTGLVTFEQEDTNAVKMHLELTVPSRANQSVAVHIHEHGSCGDMGADAHGHWNPTNQQHGKWGTGSFHSGDIGNIDLDADGKGTLTLESNLWSIGGDSTRNILNKSIIVHGGVDDYTSQPAGNSGPRIGCGVIIHQAQH